VSTWLTLIVGLGAGAAGAIITTWGGQTRERRQARTDVRDALRQATQAIQATETAIEAGQYAGHGPLPGIHEVRQALDNLETRAMLAGLPRSLVRLHHDATLTHLSSSADWEREPPGSSKRELAETTSLAAWHAATAAAELLTAATWHPWLTAPRLPWRTRQLASIYTAADLTAPRPATGAAGRRRSPTTPSVHGTPRLGKLGARRPEPAGHNPRTPSIIQTATIKNWLATYRSEILLSREWEVVAIRGRSL
jgi:hypothetical protein